MSFKTYAEINLDNLAHNIGRIREKVAPSALIPIIKANAYGHGAIPVAKRLAREGCAMFAVARIEEAMELRESGITQHILILGRIFPDDMVQAVKAGLIISIFEGQDLSWVEKACGDSGLRAGVHLKLDSGMGRVGLLLNNAADLFGRLAESKVLHVAGALHPLFDCGRKRQELCEPSAFKIPGSALNTSET